MSVVSRVLAGRVGQWFRGRGREACRLASPWCCHKPQRTASRESVGVSSWLHLAVAAVLVLAAGCASTHVGFVPRERAFNFEADTFAYANELVWEYGYDTHGVWTSHKRQPKPDYALHCFVVARSARQFFDSARFDPSQSKTNAETYRRLIRKVVHTNPRKVLPDGEKIVIPGYATLREFSRAYERLLKDECGNATQSYVQRGNWRAIFPFSRKSQAELSARLQGELAANCLPIVHLIRFPDLKINHALLVFRAEPGAEGTDFIVYDPNDPSRPVKLTFDERKRTFALARNNYFEGGPVDVYEVYSAWNY